MSNEWVGRTVSCGLKEQARDSYTSPYDIRYEHDVGDIIKAVFKGILREAKVEYQDSERVTTIEDADIDGTYDLIIDEAVDDVKSASDWSYKHKFQSYEVLKDNDSFGYVGQLAGYAKATDKKHWGLVGN